MSGDFNVAADASVNMSAGSAGAVGFGAYTIAVLVRPTVGNNNCGFLRCDASAVQQRGFIEDTLKLFGANDFSSGFGSLTQGNWYVAAQSKAAGSNLYRFHLWPYASDGSGTMSHGTSTGAANQGDGSAIDAVRIGIADDRGNGLIAAVGLWTSALSDGQLDTLVSTSLSAWSALSPAELISLENWSGATGCTAVVGTSTQSSITGSVGVGANPPSFSFSLSAAVAASGPQALPPHLLLQVLAARNAQYQPGGSGPTLFTQSLAGSITPTGTLLKQDNKPVAGAVTPTGTLTRQPGKALAGAVAPAGVIRKAISRSFAGSISPAGAVLKTLSRLLGGSITPTAALTKSRSGAAQPGDLHASQSGPDLTASQTGPDLHASQSGPELTPAQSGPRLGPSTGRSGLTAYQDPR